MLNQIRDFIKQCPLLDNVRLTVDFLEETEGVAGVFGRACEPVLEQYADGGSLRQFAFRLSLRGSNHNADSGAVSVLLEKTARWLEQAEQLPELDAGRKSQRIEVLKTGMLADRSYGSNRYDMDCRLVYYQTRSVKHE